MLNRDELILNDIIQRERFQHVFQPIFNLTTWEIMGYEALLRCDFFQNTEQLIKSAINCNRLFDIDTLSIYKALTSISNGNEKFFVNIYPSTMMNKFFFNFLEKLKGCHLLIDNIVFKINQTEKILDFSSLNRMVNTIKNDGFTIALDDFGKGEITLEIVNELEPDFLKLDRCFSDGLFKSKEKQDKIQMLLEICRKKNINLVLEGIEDSRDLAIAKVLGVQLAKGFLLGEPLSLNEYYFINKDRFQQ